LPVVFFNVVFTSYDTLRLHRYRTTGSNLMAERENLYFFNNFYSDKYDITYTHDVECKYGLLYNTL